MIQLIKKHPYWFGWLSAGLFFSISNGLEVGASAGFSTFGGFIVIGIICHVVFD